MLRDICLYVMKQASTSIFSIVGGNWDIPIQDGLLRTSTMPTEFQRVMDSI